MYYFDFDYPRVRQSLGVAALREAYPTLLLNLRGDICGINPLALWLWGELQPGEPFQPERLLGVNTFALRVRRVDHIPVEQNLEYYTKLCAMVKRGLAQRGAPARTIYEPFISMMQADPRSAEIYESAPLYPDREWEYTLKIAHPQDDGMLLEFVINVYRLSGDAGFLVVYYPKTAALGVIEEMNSRFVEEYGEGYASIAWSFDKPGDLSVFTDPANIVTVYRSYYPTLIQDPLWYLRGENEAHRLLVGTSVVGLHFFELFFSPVVKFLLGPIQDSTGPRALKYFDVFTRPYLQPDHDLHEGYMQVMQGLAQVDGFLDLLALSRRLPIHINSSAMLNLYAGSETPFYTCRVLLPWTYEPDIRLQFKSMVNFIYPEAMVVPLDTRGYRITLVPETDETDAAIMLLPLLAGQRAEEQSQPLTRQYLWLLALLKVVEEGREIAEDNTMWNPQDAFQRATEKLALCYGADAAGEMKTVMAEIQATIEVMDRNGRMDKGKLLALLHSYMKTRPELQALSEFLTEELEAEREAR